MLALDTSGPGYIKMERRQAKNGHLVRNPSLTDCALIDTMILRFDNETVYDFFHTDACSNVHYASLDDYLDREADLAYQF